MTYKTGTAFSDSVNLGSNPSPPATRNADVSGTSGAKDGAERSEQAEQTAHADRTEVGTAHTPGPWDFWSDADGAWIIQAKGVVVCQRSPWSHRAAESVANGRLFFAAPDMLAALRGLAAESEPEELLDDESEVWQRVHAAIAKAEGRE